MGLFSKKVYVWCNQCGYWEEHKMNGFNAMKISGLTGRPCPKCDTGHLSPITKENLDLELARMAKKKAQK